MNKIRKTPPGLDCPTVSPEEFIAGDEDIVYIVPMMADKDNLELVQSSKNITGADSDDENEMNNVSPVPSEMRNIMKNMRNYLDTHSNSEMNKKIDGISNNLLVCILATKPLQQCPFKLISDPLALDDRNS
ncbi:hypothetical protein TNCV_3205281 [Trichonephila clavipes]|nr:hypothetical protein TNCV_3205281 [Trichonephila clavipes]